MNILCTDLDNTLIYSYKHDIGNQRRNVEIYQGREISFITEKTYELLLEVKDQLQILPVTTRTKEQYDRIDLGIGDLPYALVCNGGILLRGGEVDADWYEESLRLIRDARDELEQALCFLEQERRRTFELRFIEKLFVFTKCNHPEAVTDELKRNLDGRKVQVFHNGEKVYVVPVDLSKGMALKRVRKYLAPEWIFAAGDSGFDLSMVEEAEYGIVPCHFKERFATVDSVQEVPGKKIFSEEVLEICLKKAGVNLRQP